MAEVLPVGRVLGAPVSVGTLAGVAEAVLRRAAARAGGYVCVANVHMVVTARDDARLRSAMEGAAVVTSDGMPLVWSLRRQGHAAERVAGPDLMLALLARAEAESRPVFFLGGSPETGRRLQAVLSARYPGLSVVGIESPPQLPTDPPLDPLVQRRIESSGAELVFVGLGCPKQELWMARHAPGMTAVLLGVGAAFDFLAGTVARAPAWMQARGLEWLWRLGQEPGRLWRRYLVTNTRYLWYAIRE